MNPMTPNEAALKSALTFIRDSTFRDAASLRAYADKVLNEYRAGDFAAAPSPAEAGEAEASLQVNRTLYGWRVQADDVIYQLLDTDEGREANVARVLCKAFAATPPRKAEDWQATIDRIVPAIEGAPADDPDLCCQHMLSRDRDRIRRALARLPYQPRVEGGENWVPAGWRDLAEANNRIVDEIRAIVLPGNRPGNVIEAVRALATPQPENAKHVCAYRDDCPACERLRERVRAEITTPQPERREDAALAMVLAEVERAVRKFPTWPTDPLHAVAVVGEEAGELTKAVLQAVYEPHKSTPDDVAAEAVQLTAMGLRFLRSLSKYDYARGEQHEQPALTPTPQENAPK